MFPASREDGVPELLGAIEAGGTKFVLAVGTGHKDITAQTVIPTTTPDETLATALDWFKEQGHLAALGISCFGPVELDRKSSKWGYITQTTKSGWSDTDVAGHLGQALDCPVGFDTDVNGAVLGEFTHGAARDCHVAIYVTVGTGIGGGAIVNGAPLHGFRHPEMGHVRPRRHADDILFDGICSFHDDCLEGLASGPAIMKRWGSSLSELPNDHPAHEIIADYLGQLCATLLALYSPQRIILGGGVMHTPVLLDRIRAKTGQLSKAYFAYDAESTICAPELGALSGITGAFELARKVIHVKK